MQTRELGIAVVGSGRIGSLRARLAAGHPTVKFLAVSDLDPGRAARLAKACGADFSSGDNNEVIAHPQVDAVIVSTSEHEHLAPVMQALELGKPVLVEKPIALTLADADLIIAKSEETGTPIRVGYAQRFKRRYLSAKDQILQGRLGEITALTGRACNTRAQGMEIPDLEFKTAFLSSSTPGNWHLDDDGGPVADESRVWLDHLSRDRAFPMATARDARQTLEITLAIEESARTRKALALN